MSTSIAPRLTLHDIAKTAMAEGIKNARINEEAARQLTEPEGKTASAPGSLQPNHVPTDEAMKLAEVFEFSLDLLKQSAIQLPSPIGSGKQEPGKGPGAIHVMETQAEGAISDNVGQARNQPPHTGLQSARPKDPTTQLVNDYDHRAGGSAKQQVVGHKQASFRNKLADMMTQPPESDPAAGAAAQGGAGGAAGGPPMGAGGGGPPPELMAQLAQLPPEVLMKLIATLQAQGGGMPGGMGTEGPPPGVGGSPQGLSPDAAAMMEGSPKAAAPYNLLKKIAEDEKLEERESKGMDKAKKGLEEAEKAHGEEKKEGSVGTELLDFILSRTKTAEDAINPAHISAGSAVPPDTSAAGESGGAPVGGQPQGPRHLVDSSQAAIDYKRREAYANRKHDLATYLSEPALTSSTDHVLNNAWTHTEQAGPKIASADMAKVAAGRALLTKLAQAFEEK